MSLEDESQYKQFYNKPVVVHRNGQIVYGVLQPIKDRASFAEFLPSVVVSGLGDSKLILEADLPTVMALPLEVIRPLKPGMIELFIEEYNKKLDSQRLNTPQTLS